MLIRSPYCHVTSHLILIRPIKEARSEFIRIHIGNNYYACMMDRDLIHTVELTQVETSWYNLLLFFELERLKAPSLSSRFISTVGWSICDAIKFYKAQIFFYKIKRDYFWLIRNGLINQGVNVDCWSVAQPSGNRPILLFVNGQA